MPGVMASLTPLDILCLGGATLDRKYRSRAPLVAGSSNPASAHISAGGVARNVCETLARLGARAGLATLVGDDDAGRRIVADLAALGADVSAVRTVAGERTAEYVAVLDADGSLATGLADMAIFERFDLPDLERLALALTSARWVFADCNLPAPILAALITLAADAPFRLALDPVSVAKAARLPPRLDGVDLMILNRDEAAALTQTDEPQEAIDRLRDRGAGSVVLTDGSGPVRIASPEGRALVPVEAATVLDVTGAGDALIGATLAGLAGGFDLVEAVRAAVRVAALAVASAETVRTDLTPDLIHPEARSVA
jgi:pseudouridine kinase